MKVAQKSIRGQSARLAAECGIFFLCGPDEGGAIAAASHIVEQFPDAGERIELSGADLRRDPAALGDEARTTSLFGDARHIWVRATGDDAHDAVKAMLETGDAGGAAGCPVVIVATAATDKSRTAKLLDKRKDAVVAMFYPPDLGSVRQSVRAMADAAGLKLSGDLADRIAAGAKLDVRVAQSEVTKLALYCDASPQAPRAADAAAYEAVGAGSEEDGFAPLINAVLSGRTAQLDDELRRMRDLSLNPVGVLLAFERRAAQLAQLAARLGTRGDVERFMQGEKDARRIFFRDAGDLTDQLQRWRGKRLERLVAKLMGLHQSLLANSQSAQMLLSQGLAEITRAAAPKR